MGKRPLYLKRRGAVYYYRRPIPKKHIGLWLGPSGKPCKEWGLSLRTKDRSTAIDRMDDAAQRYRAELEARLKKPDGPASNVAPMADILEHMSRDRFEHWEADMEHQQQMLFEDEQRVQTDPLWEERKALAAERSKLEWQRDSAELLRKVKREERARNSVSVLELFEGYALGAKARPATIAGFRSHVRSFVEQSGVNDALLIELRHVLGWIEWLRARPGRRGANLSEKTIRTSYLAALRLTLSHGVNKLLLPRNVMKDLSLAQAKKTRLNRERHFSEEERNTLLSAALQPASSGTSKYVAAARRWAPWLCAYTGARVGEILQLRKCDVQRQDGIWAIHITPLAGNIKTDIPRWVPLHEHLIAQGFLAWVTDQGRERLFYKERSASAPMRTSPPYQAIYNRLRLWIREHVTDPDVQPNHAWRHTLKSLARDFEMEGDVIDAIQGHRPATVGKSYGSISMKAKMRALAKLPRFGVAL